MDTPTTNNLIEESENLKRTLNERLEVHDNSRRAAQDKLHEICEGLKKQIDEFENKINHELEDKFNKEDNRLQDVLNNLRDIDMDKHNDNDINRLQQAIQKAKAELLVMQSYEIIQCGNKEQTTELLKKRQEESAMKKAKIEVETELELVFNPMKMWELKVDKKLVFEMLDLRKPKNICINNSTNGKISIQFTHLNTDEKRVLSQHNLMNQIKYKCLFSKKMCKNNVIDKQINKEYTLNETGDCFTFVPDIFEVGATYEIRVKVMPCDKESEWSDETAEFTTPEFNECCVWKKCPDYVYKDKKYSVDENNSRIVTKVGDDQCIAIGNTYIPLNKITSWNIKILKLWNNSRCFIFIGVSPFDINQNMKGCRFVTDGGWYLSCYGSTLYSGPPHDYKGEKYGKIKENGKFIHIGDVIGVVMDTTKGELSFVMNGVNYGVAYEGIPLDKPLVPCVILYKNGNSVELIF